MPLVAALMAAASTADPASAQPADPPASGAAASPAEAPPAEAAPAGEPTSPAAPFQSLRTIVVDAGHGGTDTGCIGVAGVAEKELTLKLARRLADRLRMEDPTVDVRLTRDADEFVPLERRAGIANAAAADVFVSVHFNCALNTAALGVETYYLAPEGTVPCELVPGLEGEGPACWEGQSVAGTLERGIVEDLRRASATRWSGRLADEVQAALLAATRMTDRGVKQERFRVLRGLRMPGVVAELGFLTHAREGKRSLTSARLNALVAGLVAGLRRFDAVSPPFD